MTLTIVDYGSGNVRALARLAKTEDIPCSVAHDVKEISHAKALVLPGVGAFDSVARHLANSGMRQGILDRISTGLCSLLGICVGMHLLASSSEEGIEAGLNLVGGTVRRLEEAHIDVPAKVPHTGWNSVRARNGHPLLEGVDLDLGFYFMHSYHYVPEDEGDALAWSRHGPEFVCAVQHDTVYGVQFHPEKSHRNGAVLLRNFVSMAAMC